MTRQLTIAIAVIAGLTSAALPSRAAGSGSAKWWFHITVQEKSKDGDVVRINMPAGLVNAALPVLEAKSFGSGKVRVDDHELTRSDMRALLAAARSAQDGEYVTVQGRDERVRISKKGDEIRLEMNEHHDGHKQVTVRLPGEVLDALLSGAPDELDYAAALKVVSDHGAGELVSIEDEDDTVRIWIDGRNTDD